jgi:glycosyltransferase involved in cell wall biosynthesis
LRVLTFLHSFEPGGVERVALRLCRAWGAQSHLVMGRATGVMRSEADGLEYEILSRERISTAWWETLWMIARLPAVIRRVKPDVLFCAGNSYTVVSVAMKLRLGKACPPIIAKVSNDLARADMPWPVRAMYHRWLRVQGRLIDRFVGMAPPMLAEISDAMAIEPARVAVIDDPALSMADITRLAARPDDRGQRTRFVAAGRLSPQKNFPLLVRAFAKIANGADTLTILGEGPERARIEREVAALGIIERVTLPGHVPDLVPWLARSDIFALSSDYEGVPAVIAEALAAGLAIAATDCSVSMGDMLGHGAFGTGVPVGDVDAFAAALSVARIAPLDRPAMRAQAERFTVERAAQRYLDLFTTLSQR